MLQKIIILLDFKWNEHGCTDVITITSVLHTEYLKNKANFSKKKNKQNIVY